MPASNDQNRIFFLLDQFPLGVDPSLVLEIEELKNRGIPVSIFSITKNGKTHRNINLKQIKDVQILSDLKAKFNNIFVPIFLLVRKMYSISTGLFILIKDNFKNPGFLVKFLFKFPRIIWIASKILKYPQAIIHVQGSYLCTQIAWLISRLTKKPYLVEIEAEELIKENGKIVRAISDTKGLLTRTKSSKQILKNHYGKLEIPIWPHYQSIKIHEISGEEIKKNDQFTLLIFCSNEPIEGFTALIDAFSVLDERKVLFQCIFIGCNPIIDRIKLLVYGRNLEHMVTFLNELSEEESLICMNQSHAIVIPYILKKSPNSGCFPDWVLQAMALQLPIIAFNEGIIQEVIKDFVSGILVKSGDSLSIASAIQTLYYHPEIREQFGIRAKQLIESRYNLITNINILEEIYKTVTD